MIAKVAAYLVNACAMWPAKADELVRTHAAVIAKNDAMGSHAYYIAARVIEAECERLKVEELPADFFDPNWVEVEEEETDES